jgi:predicted NBD/HSP70 family sugar kinase
MATTESCLKARPAVPCPLDPDFAPAVLANRRYRDALTRTPAPDALEVALEREDGLVARSRIALLPAGSPHDADTYRFAERHVKFLLWSRGGWKLHLAGSDALCRRLRDAYAPGGARAFDADIMRRAYDRPFTAVLTPVERLPAPLERALRLGGHLNGCRLGFDLGASDFKLAAVRDGTPVFTAEVPWQPSVQSDPQYHYRAILDGLKQAAARLPRVDAIGGSAAGIYVHNEVRAASLFRSVPPEAFESSVRTLFLRLQQEFGVPLVVINDGDVTALEGALALGRGGILGVAMGSSEAAGYVDRAGSIPGYLTELAFAPVDFSPKAPVDEWSGDAGVGASYFSQQAVNRLAPAAGIELPAGAGLPERLKLVQELAARGDERALRIFETIGVYLGYTVPHYAEHYDFSALLLLGRVTSGVGGSIILRRAGEVLAAEFPALAQRVALSLPDESRRRVGQAVAAASLPEVP